MPNRLASSAPGADPTGVVECRGSFSLHEAFKQFSAEVPAKQIPCRSLPHLMWRWFEVGSPSQPLLVLFHGVCGSAANFFLQLVALRDKGFHVISLQWPAFSSLSSFLNGLDGFLAYLHAQTPQKHTKSGKRPSNTRELHLLGAELGGLLALHYAAMRPQIVKSVILCNSFASTDQLWEAGKPLRVMMAPFLSVLPHAALRKMVISQFLRPLKPIQVTFPAPESASSNEDDADDLQGAFSTYQPNRRHREDACHVSTTDTGSEAGGADRGVLMLPQESLEIKNSKEFLIAHLDSLLAADLAARLSLYLSVDPAAYLPQLDEGDRLLILHTLDSGFPPQTEASITALFPRAKVATMRTGGPFPFLAAADEVSMHIELHMRRCGAAGKRPAEEPEVQQQQPGGDRHNQKWEAVPQTECWSAQEPADSFSWQEHRRPCTNGRPESFPKGLPKQGSSCSTSTGSGQYQPWTYASHDYEQQRSVQESPLANSGSPWNYDDRSIINRPERPRYPKKLFQSQIQPEGNAVWERTAVSCTSSSQSSSDSCHSSNVQSPVGNQAHIPFSGTQPSDCGPHVSGYPF